MPDKARLIIAPVDPGAVSYINLTLPTILRVVIVVCDGAL